MQVERKTLLEIGLIDRQSHQVVGRLQDRGALGAAGVAAVDGPAQATDEAPELHAMDDLVQQFVVSLELGQRADEPGVGVAYPPLVVADCDLPRVRLGCAYRHQEKARPPRQLGRLP